MGVTTLSLGLGLKLTTWLTPAQAATVLGTGHVLLGLAVLAQSQALQALSPNLKHRRRPMHTDRTELARGLEHDRGELEAALSRLRQAVEHRVDPKAHLKAFLGAWLLGGLACGFALGALHSRRQINAKPSFGRTLGGVLKTAGKAARALTD